MNAERLRARTRMRMRTRTRTQRGLFVLFGALAAMALLPGCPKKNKPPPVERLFMGAHVTCAELSSGELRCQGRSSEGQLGPTSTSHGPSAIPLQGKLVDVALDETATCVTTASAPRICFGKAEGEAPRVGRAPACVLRDGRVTCAGPAWKTPPRLEGLTGAVEVAEGRAHACARLVGGTVVCWGDNTKAQLATPPPHGTDVPIAVQGVYGAAQIVASGDATCVRLTEKSVRCWGSNDDERLSVGHGDVLNVPSPVHF